jgi:hypothetical protein
MRKPKRPKGRGPFPIGPARLETERLLQILKQKHGYRIIASEPEILLCPVILSRSLGLIPMSFSGSVKRRGGERVRVVGESREDKLARGQASVRTAYYDHVSPGRRGL